MLELYGIVVKRRRACGPCLAGRVDGMDDFISVCSKACLAGWLPPATGHRGLFYWGCFWLCCCGCRILPTRGLPAMPPELFRTVSHRCLDGWDGTGWLLSRCGREAQPPHVQRQVGSGQSLGWNRSCVQQACSLLNACQHVKYIFPHSPVIA